MQVVAPVVVQVAPPGAAVTVYPVMAGPPTGDAVQMTATWALPGAPTTLVGGGTTGVTGALGAEVWLLPLAAVVATTVNV